MGSNIKFNVMKLVITISKKEKKALDNAIAKSKELTHKGIKEAKMSITTFRRVWRAAKAEYQKK